MVKLSLHVTAQYCNHWPTLVVHHNEDLICEVLVKESEQINIDLDHLIL